LDWRWCIVGYSLVLPSALAFAHLALAAAESLALTAGLPRQSFLAGLGVADVPLTFAHLALPAALMAALPAALIRLLPLLAGLESVAPVPLISAHLARCAAAILALTAADLRSFLGGLLGRQDRDFTAATASSNGIDLAFQFLDLLFDGDDLAELACR
jgi:hypothetical protein